MSKITYLKRIIFLSFLILGSTSLLAQSPGGVTSNLSLWLKADAGIDETDGQAVDQWDDKSGNNYHISQSTASFRPELNTISINHNPSIDFINTTNTGGKRFNVPAGIKATGESDFSIFQVTTSGSTMNTLRLGSSTLAGQSATATVTGGNLRLTSPFDSTPSIPLKTDAANIGRISYNSTTDVKQVVANADSANGATNSNVISISNTNHIVGLGHDGYNGGAGTSGLSELVLYNGIPTALETQKIESYLALKYGITLDQTATTAYLASDGTTKMWDETVNATYNNDIFGVGRDDASGLDQRVSKSANNGSIFLASLDNDFTSANNDAARTTTFSADLQFLTFANNGGATTTQSTELDVANYNTRIIREWQAQNTGGVGAVNVKFDGFANYDLLSDTDGDFSTTGDQTVLGTLDGNGELTGVTFTDGAYLTLAYQMSAPGGVAANIALWMSADVGVTETGGVTISNWEDRTESHTPSYYNNNPDLLDSGSDLLNFNPVVDFDGDDYIRWDGDNFNNSFTSAEVFSVFKETTTLTITNGSPFDFGGAADSRHTSGNGYIYDDFGSANRKVWRPSTGTLSLTEGTSSGATLAGPLVSTLDYNIYNVSSETNNWRSAFNGATAVTDVSNTTNFTGIAHFGASSGKPFIGRIPEIIVYGAVLTVLQRQKIDSYLALKYGITLDQTAATAYLASDGTTKMWDETVNTAYNNDIFGVGRDDASGLDQRVSKSANNGSFFLASLDNDFTSANNDAARTTTFSADLQFLTFANNGGTTTKQSTELDAANYNTRIIREWQAQNTGGVGAVNVKFDGFANYDLLSDTDGDFSTTGDQTVLGTLDGNGELTGVTFTDGAYLTLAYQMSAPGGVVDNIALWMSADVGVTETGGVTISNWEDRTESHTPSYYNNNPDLLDSGSDLLNFNPVVDFDGDDYISWNGDNFNNSFTSAEVFSVFKETTALTNSNGSPFDFGGGSDSRHTHSNGYIYDDFGSSNRKVWRPSTGDLSLTEGTASGATLAGPLVSTLDYNIYNVSSETNNWRSAFNGATAVTDVSNTTDFTGIAHFGGRSGKPFIGRIPEIIVYDAVLTVLQRQKIDSYLALKYGITLDQTAATAYLASDGTTKMWDETVNTAYNNDIFGVGRDDASGLDQRVSKSANNGSFFLASLDNDFTSANNDAARTTNFSADLQFLTFANNGGATIAQSTELDAANYNTRIIREWQAQNTGGVGAVNVKFNGFANYDLLSDTDGDFSTTGDQTVLGTLDGNGELTGVTFTDGAYLTLAYQMSAPGGVAANIALWMSADVGVTETGGATITNWEDRTESHTPSYYNSNPDLLDSGNDLLNFNPVVDFNGNDYIRWDGDNFNNSFTSAEVFSVFKETTALTITNGPPFDFGGGSDSFHTLSNGYIYDDFGSADRKVWRPSTGDLRLTEGTASGATLAGPLVSTLDYNIYNVSSETNNWRSAFNGATAVTDVSNTTNFTGIAHFGASSRKPFTGRIPEIIVYDAVLTVLQRQKIDSYLALKYGITLDQTAATAYLASDGTTKMWDETVNTAYNNDIFGVGRDDASGLDQRVSKSANNGSIFIASLDNDFTSANNDAARTTNFSADLQFLTFANNGGATIAQSTELDAANYNTRIIREWQAQNPGGVGAVNVKFDGFANYDLLSDTDGDFSTTGDQTVLGTLDGNGELTGVTFTDGAYLTLAYQMSAPGGVAANIALWMSADVGVTETGGFTISNWEDRTKSHTPSYYNSNPDLLDSGNDLLNFNPVVGFDGNDYIRWDGDNFNNSFTSAEVFSVFKETTTLTNYNGSPFDFGGAADSWHTNSNGYIYDDFGSANRKVWRPSTGDLSLTEGTASGATLAGPLVSTLDYNIYNVSSETNNWRSAFNGATAVTDVSNTTDFTGIAHFGGRRGKPFIGRIPEIIVYDAVLTVLQRQKIDSYLALKYGITLDQTAATAYLASDGTTKMWDETVNTAYNNDIFGVGRDDASGLDQRVSKSANNGSFFLASLDNDFTSANNDAARTTTFSADLQFLTFANNGGATTKQSTELDAANYNTRIIREWQAQNPEGVGAVNVKFDGFANYDLLSDTDGDFSTTGDQTVLGTLDGNGELTGVTFTDGAYLTLAYQMSAPGGVVDNIALWMSADVGVTETGGVTISNWEDRTKSHTPSYYNSNPSLLDSGNDLLNFNPVVGFDGNDYIRWDGDNFNNSFTSAEVFSVFKETTTLTNYNGSPFDFGGAADSWHTNSNGYIYDDFGSANRKVWRPSTGDLSLTEGTASGATLAGPLVSTLDYNIYNVSSETNNWRSAFNGATAVTDVSNTTDFAGIAHFGGRSGKPFIGRIPEIIVYDAVLTVLQRQKIDSYLALKYGITLDQTAATAYLASDGTTKMWDETVNTAYNNDIFGVGRDDASGLDQRVSKSANNGSIFIASLDNDFTSANNDAARTTTFSADLQFLTFANNGGATTTQATEIDLTNYTSRIIREWQVNNEGSVGVVNVKFDGFADYKILSDPDGDFSTTTGQTVLGTLDTNGEATDITFVDGEYVTLAKAIDTQVIEDYADDNANPAPTESDYTDVGVTGVTADNLAQVNAAIDALESTDVDTPAKIQAIVDAINSGNIIEDYADDNANPAPTESDYTDVGVTGVDAENLAEVNAAIDALESTDVDTPAEIQAIVDAINAGNIIEDYADDNANPAPTESDYTDAGVTGVTADNLAQVNAAIDALTGTDVDTPAEIQAIVDAINAGNIIEDYADNNANPAPTESDYTDAGVTGVDAENLAEVNAAIDALESTDVDTPAEIQAIVDAINAGNIIEDYADDNANPAPTESDYTDVGVTGVDAENLAEVNDAIDALTGTDIDTPAEIQAIVDAINAGNIIEDYADDNANPAPTESDYTDVGVTGVDAENLAEVNAAIDALTGTDVDTPAEIQAIVDAINAGNIIEDYADDNANPAPTESDYTDAGVTGVTADNLAQVNAAIDALTGTDVDTPAEIQAIVDAINAGNIIEDYADNNANPAPTESDYTDAGVTGVTADNLVQVNAAIDALTGTDVDTPAEIQAIVDAINAGNIIEDYADNNANPAPTESDYTDAGVTGVDAENLAEVNAAIDALESTDVDTPAEIQAIVDAINAGNIIEDYADDNANPAPTESDYTDVGVTGVTADNLAQVNAAIDALTGTDIDTPAEIQAIVDAINAGNIIEDYADNNANPAPTESDYTDAGVTGVDAENLAEVNAAIDALTGTDVDTPAEIQAIVDAINAGNIIEDYADNNANPAPTESDYTDASVTGVDAENLAEVNAAIDALESTDVDTPAKIQAIVDAINAGNVIEDYVDNNANPAPTETDYTDAGVTGVTADNLAQVNAAIDALESTDVDTPAKIQAIVDAINAENEIIAEVLEDSDSTGGANNANGTAVTAVELASITGINGVLPAYEEAYQAAIAAETGFSNPPTLAEIQLIIDTVNSRDDDNDGLPDAIDPDNNNIDTDGDGIPDGSDVDVDGDGTNDNGTDTDGDGINDESDVDVNGDGTDDNGTDSDGDGINDENDTIDNNADADGDGLPDAIDPDDNNTDTDGDGINDIAEDSNGDGDLSNDDCDNDGTPDFMDTDPCGEAGSISTVISAKAFTPNGDGINDGWVIKGIEHYPNNQVSVYNRYGHEVFSANGYQNNWEAQYKSNTDKLPAGSYYYVINLGDGSPPIDGWLFINY